MISFKTINTSKLKTLMVELEYSILNHLTHDFSDIFLKNYPTFLKLRIHDESNVKITKRKNILV